MARVCLFTFKSSIFQIDRKKIHLKFKSNGSYLYATLHKNAASTNRFKENLHESDSDSDAEIHEERDLSDLKIRIMEAGLQFVPDHGWSKKSVALGANSLGLSSAIHGLIDHGGSDLVHYYNNNSNKKLETYLKEKYSTQEKYEIQDYIRDALEKRLKMAIPFTSRLPEAMALLVSPYEYPTANKNLMDLADIIVHYSNDKSLDITWYSKRLSIAMIYKACEFSLVQDKSPEFADTYDFLQRRVQMLMNANSFMNQVSTAAKYLPEFRSGAFITIQNLLGANRYFM